jgi:hypothetical protein
MLHSFALFLKNKLYFSAALLPRFRKTDRCVLASLVLFYSNFG